MGFKTIPKGDTKIQGKRNLCSEKLQSYIFGLFRKGVSAVRCNSVLEKIEADTLIGYEIDRVAGLLSDNRISNEFLEIYLRYFP